LKPLRLTWTLATPIVVGAYPLHLDALVAFAMAAQGKENDLASWDENATLKLPLQVAKHDGIDCWMASGLTPVVPAEHAMRFWTRKTDQYDYAVRMEAQQFDVKTKWPLKPYGIKIDTLRGTFKQMFKFFPVKSVNQLQAWCVGDEDVLAELLSPESGYLTYLGSKTRMGMGRISQFDIVDDASAILNWKNRVMPWAEPGYVEVEAAAKMPYWAPGNRTTAWVNPEIFG
jgi:CRISPR type IV-associated protein Csf3